MNETTTTETKAPRAMLLHLSFTFGRKGGKDKELTKNVVEEHNAQKGGLTVGKLYICREAFKPLTDIRDAFRNACDRVTLPWDIKGMRFVKPTSVIKVMQAKDHYGPEFETMKQEHLIGKYDQWKELTKTQVGDRYDDTKFPSLLTLEEEVSYHWSLSVLPESEAIKKIQHIDENLLAAMKESEDKRVQKAINAGMEDAWKRMTEPLENMVVVLTSDKPKIYESLIGNVKTVLENVADLNFVEDALLTKFASKTQKLMEELDIAVLRKDEVVRKDVAERAKLLLDAFGGLGARKINAA